MTQRAETEYPAEPTGWVGWIIFAGTMLVILGIFHAIQGLVALFNDSVYLVGPKGLVINVDYTAWGWIHLIGGIIVVLAGVALFAGKMWARILAVIVHPRDAKQIATPEPKKP